MHLQSTKPKQHNYRFMMKLILAIVILVSFSPGSVWAQEPDVEPQEVTLFCDNSKCGNQVWRLTLEMWNVGSEGGEAYAQVIASGYDCVNDKFGDNLKRYPWGTFSGGPNGILTEVSNVDGTLLNSFHLVDGKAIIESGVTVCTVQNPEAFDGWLAEPITSEYIYKTYGIRVEDSFGDDQWEQKSWSDQELILLNDVLKELPPGLLSKMAVTRIIRNKVKIDANGNPKPDVYGTYYSCGSPPEADCTSASGTIRIFDNAFTPLDFSNDPNGYTEFKGSILHELTHALQYKKDEYSNYKNAYFSPVVQNYMDATRPITNINDPGFEGTNGWTFGKHPPNSPSARWKLFGTPDNKPPTNYGGKNPLEDMSESVMMYVYEPQKLQGSSPQRYNFIRDQIFEGVEYENGTQKKP
jgi:hypothetical protein